MIRVALVVVCGGLLFAGCAARDAAQADPAAPGDGSGNAQAGSGAPKTPIVRSLIGVIDEVDVKGEGREVKDELKQSLQEADEQLSQVLRGNSKRLIMEANKKPPIPIVGGPGQTAPVSTETETEKPKSTESDAEEPDAEKSGDEKPQGENQ